MYLRFEVTVVGEDGAELSIQRRIEAALTFDDGSTIALLGPAPKAFTIGLITKGT